jgi:hypothetical protein
MVEAIKDNKDLRNSQELGRNLPAEIADKIKMPVDRVTEY